MLEWLKFCYLGLKKILFCLGLTMWNENAENVIKCYGMNVLMLSDVYMIKRTSYIEYYLG